jgi:hypothetical protein
MLTLNKLNLDGLWLITGIRQKSKTRLSFLTDIKKISYNLKAIATT